MCRTACLFQYPRPEYVAADLSKVKLADALARTSYDPSKRSLFIAGEFYASGVEAGNCQHVLLLLGTDQRLSSCKTGAVACRCIIMPNLTRHCAATAASINTGCCSHQLDHSMSFL
jgi:hypothetical protein